MSLGLFFLCNMSSLTLLHDLPSIFCFPVISLSIHPSTTPDSPSSASAQYWLSHCSLPMDQLSSVPLFVHPVSPSLAHLWGWGLLQSVITIPFTPRTIIL